MSEIPPDTVDRARRGEEAALQELAKAVYPTVRRWALVRTGDAAEADDLTQDVLILMIRRLDSFQGDSGFGTWLYSITRNASTDRFRARRRKERLKEDPRTVIDIAPQHWDDPSKRLERKEINDVIEAFFEELPERQREVFDLVELQGIPPVEVAAMLGIEPVSVRANLFKARRRMRARILDTHPEIAEDAR